MMAAPDDSSVCWWYSGWTFVTIDGYPEFPMSQVAAIMTYRAATLPGESFRIHWSEIGCFRDPATSELPEQWTNPVTGAQLAMPRSFKEGPGSYTITRAADGVALQLDQPTARVLDLSVDFRAGSERCWFRQRERKVRGFPLPDGTPPVIGASAGFESVTELSFFASTRDLERSDNAFVPAQGIYYFRLSGIPPWMGFGDLRGYTTTSGTITKALPGQKVDRISWERLAELFPAEI
jgi:hypothetical protein